MKIHNKLILAFLIMITFLIAAMLVSINVVLDREASSIRSTFSSYPTHGSKWDLVLSPVNFFCNITSGDQEALINLAQKTPEVFQNDEFLNNTNDKLRKKSSYLVVLCDGKYTFIGNKEHFLAMMGYSFNDQTHSNHNRELTHIDPTHHTLFSEEYFSFPDGKSGQFLLVTDMNQLHASWVKCIRNIVCTFFITFTVIDLLFAIWVYRSIIYPINLLTIATREIGNGNLDTPVQASTSDEIGQLYQNLEDMRLRLRSMIEAHMTAEENAKILVSNFSHDLRTPTTAIKGYAEGLLDGVANTPEKRTKYLQTILHKANDINYLVDELSVYSQINRNSLPYHFTSVILDSYFSQCIDELRSDLELNHINLEYHNNTSPSTRIIVDTIQFKRILQNIVGNAAKYNDKPQGRVCISVSDYKPNTLPPLYRQIDEDDAEAQYEKESKPTEFAIVQIKDNGPGIAEEDMPHLFDRSYRGDASRNSAIRGNGFGLSIVKMIVSNHGGKVWCKSKPGNGASFYFTIRKDSTERKEADEQNIDY